MSFAGPAVGLAARRNVQAVGLVEKERLDPVGQGVEPEVGDACV